VRFSPKLDSGCIMLPTTAQSKDVKDIRVQTSSVYVMLSFKEHYAHIEMTFKEGVKNLPMGWS
jgi:hypothetical protein